jgi:hypothetical protein
MKGYICHTFNRLPIINQIPDPINEIRSVAICRNGKPIVGLRKPIATNTKETKGDGKGCRGSTGEGPIKSQLRQKRRGDETSKQINTHSDKRESGWAKMWCIASFANLGHNGWWLWSAQYTPNAGAVHTQGRSHLVALAIETLWDTIEGGSRERFAEPVRRNVLPLD